MNFKHKLPGFWVEQTSQMVEFKNGGAQVSIQTNDGKLHQKVLISNSQRIIAMRGERKLPFKVETIAEIFQTEEDKTRRLVTIGNIGTSGSSTHDFPQ